MSFIRDRIAVGVLAAIALWSGLAACNGTLTAAAQDPCTLLSAAEAGPYVGALAIPPFRASDGAADVHGDECVYRGTSGREITVRPDWTGAGGDAGAAVQGAANLVGGALDRGGAGGDSMAHRVVKSETAGPWDRATWIPGGSLFASKGSVSAQVDVSGASGQENDALALARIIMPRFAHPLAYDGAKAVALVPKPTPHPAAACDLVPRSVVEAAIGPITGTPTSDAPETSCRWTVSTPQGDRVYAVEFTWQGGQKNFMMQQHSMATVAPLLGAPATSPLDTMQPPPQMQAMMGGLMKMVGGKAAEGKAPGATSTVGFRTDTTLVGPWDHAALMHGTMLMAVRHDVFVGMDLQSADYEKAKALLAAICSRL
jgi:hypothetical protein